MLTNKLYKCNECQTLVKIRSKGLCSYCSFKSKGSQVKIYKIKQQSAKNKEKRKNKQEIMRPYWEYHLENIQIHPHCENCGCNINGNIMNIAHILPKRNFGGNPEVSFELENCAYLCSSFDGIDCHSRFDRIATTSKVYLMPVWEKMIKRYLMFKDKVLKYNKYVEIFENYITDGI